MPNNTTTTRTPTTSLWDGSGRGRNPARGGDCAVAADGGRHPKSPRRGRGRSRCKPGNKRTACNSTRKHWSSAPRSCGTSTKNKPRCNTSWRRPSSRAGRASSGSSAVSDDEDDDVAMMTAEEMEQMAADQSAQETRVQQQMQELPTVSTNQSTTFGEDAAAAPPTVAEKRRTTCRRLLLLPAKSSWRLHPRRICNLSNFRRCVRFGRLLRAPHAVSYRPSPPNHNARRCSTLPPARC